MGSNSQQYDSRGNVAEDQYNSIYTWGFKNELTLAVVSNATIGMPGTHAFEYDAIGRRVSLESLLTTGDINRKVFVNRRTPLPAAPTFGGQVYAEYDTTVGNSPTLIRNYAYGQYVDEPLFLLDYTQAGSLGPTGHEYFYYHLSRNYNVFAISDSSGMAVEYYSYAPHKRNQSIWAPNEGLVTNSTIGNPYGPTGRRRDSETGLLYFRARMLDSATQLFMARDPLGYSPASKFSPCLYGYEYLGLDPSGMAWISCSCMYIRSYYIKQKTVSVNCPGLGNSCCKAICNDQKPKDMYLSATSWSFEGPGGGGHCYFYARPDITGDKYADTCRCTHYDIYSLPRTNCTRKCAGWRRRRNESIKKEGHSSISHWDRLSFIWRPGNTRQIMSRRDL